MIKQEAKTILKAILVGACVAFLSSLFDGLLTLLQDYGNNAVGGVIGGSIYARNTYLRGRG